MILGVTLGFLSSACILRDGEVLAAASEERFSRLKSDMGYPRQAIEYCLQVADIAGSEVDIVALASEEHNADDMLIRRYSSFSVADWIREQREWFYPVVYEDKEVNFLEIFRDKVRLHDDPWDWGQFDLSSPRRNDPDRGAKFSEMRKRVISRHLGVEIGKIVMVNHHVAHAIYGYYASPVRHLTALILTMDGIGDDANAAIAVMRDGRMSQIFKTDDCHMGRLWKSMTLLLGMKPHQDEYKVMGLAPYASEYHMRGPLEVFRGTMTVDNLGFKYQERPSENYFWFRDRLMPFRFDGIAAGLQRYLEEIFCQWVRNAIKHTGIRNVYLSGGVSMNVKAAMSVSQIDELEDISVPPSCGDESLCLGAAWAYLHQQCEANGVDPLDKIAPLHDAYLGPQYTATEIESVIRRNRSRDKYIVTRNVTPRSVAQHLANGKVIGRLAGRMEFGARALGNRSILADPRNTETLKLINHKIKNRDFWMPFAPTVLQHEAAAYVVNVKNLTSPYMTMAFPSTARAQTEIPAAVHPMDSTLRPQILSRDHNRSFFDIVSEFGSLTGVHALLNTSFNLHGEPIVQSPSDAFDTFASSGLDMLLLEDTLVAKKPASPR